MPKLPAGTVTFLFADVEGSTRRLEADTAATGRTLAQFIDSTQHEVERAHGVVFETVGDAAYAAFQRPSDALVAAANVHEALGRLDGNSPVKVRISIHTGEVESRGRHYFGPALFLCARLQALAWGGQTVVSSATAALVAHSIPVGFRLVERGPHKLKDLAEPEIVFELVGPTTATFPPLRSIGARSNNLPDQLPLLVGRAGDIEEVERLLQTSRVVTITGTGGTGKTALALAVAARRLPDSEDGVWFVDLASTRDPELVPAAIAATIGVSEQPPARLEDTLAGYLATRSVLVVLDNFEQVADAGPAVVKMFGSPSPAKMIVTSREPLRVREEHVYALAPLGVVRARPDATLDEIGTSPSVQLFVERASDAAPFELTPSNAHAVASICARLDGLPLAIELAAPLVRVMLPQELLDRLRSRLDLLAARSRDLPHRQRTLRAALSWSHDLLTDDEQRAFRRLAVFEDGFSLSAAEAVLGSDGGVADPIGEIGALLDKSLLVRDLDPLGDARFRMLETIRVFAVEQLAGSPDADSAREALVDWATRLVTKDGQSMRWADAFPRVDRFRAEHANIVGAIRWLYDSGRTAEFAELTGAVSSFWLAASMRTQAQPWLRLASDLQLATSPATARLLRNAGTIELELGDSRRAVDLIRRSIEQWAALGNDAERGDALRRLGGTLLDRGEMSEARAILEEAVELARAVDDGTTLRAALSDLAAVALIDGDLEQAHALALELLEASTRSGDRYGIAFAHYNLAYVLVERGAYVEAEAQIRDAILLFREVGKPEELAWANSTLAGIMLATNRSDAAADTIRLAIRPTPDGGNVAQLAAALDISAQIAVERGDDERAIRLAVAAERLRAGAELTLSPGERQRFDETIATARERLGPAYDRVAETARQTPIDAIVAAEHAEAEASPSPQ